jgi:hypothetical protein
MKIGLSLVVLTLAGEFSSRCIFSQSITVNTSSPNETVTITEPGRFTLEQLFKMSDVVAAVQVVAGDTENYKTAIYKAHVIKNFKGTNEGKTIYFGPFVGYKLGSEYFLFLRDAKRTAAPIASQSAAYGIVNYLEIFNQGYSAMENSYSCVFDGSMPKQSCDYGVRVCTDYITLPKGVHAFPPEKDDPPFGCRWVRKSKFVSILNGFAEQSGALQSPVLAR